MRNIIQKSKSGFTIIEILVALGIVAMGLMGILALVQQNLQVESVNADYLIASNLAQEGMELVRNVRDNNWLKQPAVSWDDGLYIAGHEPTYWAIDYNSNKTEITTSPAISQAAAKLYFTPGGFYTHVVLGNTITRFSRVIKISRPNPPNNPNELNVTCEVKWNERGRDHSYTTDTLLYNWR